MTPNVGRIDRAVRILAGLGLLSLLVLVTSEWRWLGLIGLVPLATAFLGWCPAYRLVGLSTCPVARKAGAP